MITNDESALGGRPVPDGLAPLTQSSALAITLTEPSRGWVLLKLRELWEYREVLRTRCANVRMPHHFRGSIPVS